jgi:hypothetical protein
MKPGTASFLLLEVSSILWSGCASSAPPLPPSLELPAPVTDLRAVRKGDKVYLAWTVPSQTTDRERVRSVGATQICRSVEAAMSECGTLVSQSPTPVAAGTPATARTSASKKAVQAPPLTATYVDSVSSTLGSSLASVATYAVQVLNDRNRGAGLSNRVKVSLAPTLPPVPDFSAGVTAEGVLLSWRCPAASRQDVANFDHRLRIYRREEKTANEAQAGEIDLKSCLNPAMSISGAVSGEAEKRLQFLDTSFEWEKTYSYRAAVVTVVPQPGQPEIQVEGDDTPGVTVFAHDVFPPSVPLGLQAVFSGVGQQPFIDLVWTPDSDADLAGYNVYRHTKGGAPVRINSELVKTPAYRDAGVQPATKYFYSVASVDVRGNESARSQEAAEAVP